MGILVCGAVVYQIIDTPVNEGYNMMPTICFVNSIPVVLSDGYKEIRTRSLQISAYIGMLWHPSDTQLLARLSERPSCICITCVDLGAVC